MTRLVTNVAHALRGSAVTLGRSAAIILGVDDIWCARRRRRRGVEGCVRAAGVGSSARGARTAAESPSAVTFRGNCHRAEGGGAPRRTHWWRGPRGCGRSHALGRRRPGYARCDVRLVWRSLVGAMWGGGAQPPRPPLLATDSCRGGVRDICRCGVLLGGAPLGVGEFKEPFLKLACDRRSRARAAPSAPRRRYSALRIGIPKNPI